MKYLLITLTLITTLSLNAQKSNDHFVLEEGKVSWQKVYETKKTKEEIITHFKSSGLFKLFRVDDGKIIATLRPQQIDRTKTGIASIPEIVLKTNFAGTVIIGLKEEKYRVTYKDILLVGTGEMIKKGEKQKFEKHYVTKDGTAYRPFFSKKPSPIYNQHFNELFLIEVEKKDEW
ncbi:MAG: hypothetical protein COA97_07765 [Flavobacteriales bacterium]|nr:MAG: hypothetical protein COA97_07765 [Flavobacteriales bacterium]